MKATLTRPFWTRKDTKSFRDACLWVSWTLLTSIIDFFSSIFLFDLFVCLFFLLSFALHFGSSAHRPGYLGIVALASCTYYGLSLKPSPQTLSQWVTGCTSPAYMLIHHQIQEALRPSFLPMDKSRGWQGWGGGQSDDGSAVFKVECYLMDLRQCLTADPGKPEMPSACHPYGSWSELNPSWRSFAWWRPFRIRMWNSAAVHLII